MGLMARKTSKKVESNTDGPKWIFQWLSEVADQGEEEKKESGGYICESWRSMVSQQISL